MLASVREQIRADAGAAVLDALPAAPLLAEEIAGDFVVVERADPLGDKTFRVDRQRALAWLRDFHAATSRGSREWTQDDEDTALRSVAQAWGRYRREGQEATLTAVARLSKRAEEDTGAALCRPRRFLDGEHCR